jgi:hypothetical protein
LKNPTDKVFYLWVSSICGGKLLEFFSEFRCISELNYRGLFDVANCLRPTFLPDGKNLNWSEETTCILISRRR